MREVRTYSVTIRGEDFPPVLFSRRSAAQARAAAWRAYSNYRAVTFGQFLKISKLKRVENPPGVGTKILVQGQPAVRLGAVGPYVAFMYEGSDTPLVSHPSDVQPA